MPRTLAAGNSEEQPVAEAEMAVRAVGAADFEALVLARSKVVPVVVDFWAAWCGPCKMVAPLLERLAPQFDGVADIVKVDTDAEPEIAARYGVRSLPTLALFANGELADALVGAQPEAVIRTLLERNIERPADRERRSALAAAAGGDVDAAVATLERLVAAEADRAEPLLALVAVLIESGRLAAAAARIDAAPMRLTADPRFEALRSRLELARAAAAEGAPGSTTARYATAAREFLAGEHASAVASWLELMGGEPGFGGGALPRALKAAFALLGDDHELVASSRRRMASLMH
jgi:putative thioredoxin